MESETVKEMNLEIDKEMNPWAYNLEVDDEYNYLNKILSIGHLVISSAQLSTNNDNGSQKLLESYQKNNEQCLNNMAEQFRNIAIQLSGGMERMEQRTSNQLVSNQDRMMDMMETFTGKTKTSQSKGEIAENFLEETLNRAFPNDIVNNCSGVAHESDIQLVSTEHPTIILESKNYTSIVQKKEVEKLKDDMKRTNIKYGVFVSFNSKIIGKKHLEIEQFDDMYIMYVSNIGFNGDFVVMAIKTMIEISKIGNKQTTLVSKELIKDKIGKVIILLQKLTEIPASLSKTRTVLIEEQNMIRGSLDKIHTAYINNEAVTRRIINDIENEINTELCSLSDIDYEGCNNIEALVSNVEEKKQNLFRNIVTQLITNGYSVRKNDDDGLYDIFKTNTHELVSRFNLKQSRLNIPSMNCQFDFKKKSDLSNLECYFKILEKL